MVNISTTSKTDIILLSFVRDKQLEFSWCLRRQINVLKTSGERDGKGKGFKNYLQENLLNIIRNIKCWSRWFMFFHRL